MFEFDVNKSKSNLAKHGIDFETTGRLWTDPQRIEIPARTVDELRSMLIAKLNDKVWSAIFTHVEESIRIISVRRARKNEEEIYYSI
ncbi:BrnT family toxin [Reichenbachiella sp. MALMAid0571]|uniref:BrnT family toxin n=1 Tax=Reichenbachiella sp. MALMAid0571 TaxID=3143939 RepID=UPI0032DE4791